MSIWFKKFSARRRASLRLFGFPYAGGNASIFDGWAEQLPDGVELLAVQAPGRANRFGEAPIGVLADKVSALELAIAPYLDLPCVFFGHSNGALTAFELARRLQLGGNNALRHLIVSGKRAPHLPRRLPILHNLPDAELIEQLRRLDATPAEILDQPEVLALFLPMLRADFALSETSIIEPQPRLRARCTLFFGREDEMERDDMLAWRDYIDGPLTLREFEGGHFFINERRDACLGVLRDLLLAEFGLRHPGSTHEPTARLSA